MYSLKTFKQMLNWSHIWRFVIIKCSAPPKPESGVGKRIKAPFNLLNTKIYIYYNIHIFFAPSPRLFFVCVRWTVVCLCCELSVFLENLVYDLEAGRADTKQCSFSLCQLIETNPVLTPSSGISTNLLLMTGRGGWVDREEWGWGRGFRWSNILFLKSDHVAPPPHLQTIPLSFSISPPSHDREDIFINSPI